MSDPHMPELADRELRAKLAVLADYWDAGGNEDGWVGARYAADKIRALLAATTPIDERCDALGPRSDVDQRCVLLLGHEGWHEAAGEAAFPGFPLRWIGPQCPCGGAPFTVEHGTHDIEWHKANPTPDWWFAPPSSVAEPLS